MKPCNYCKAWNENTALFCDQCKSDISSNHLNVVIVASENYSVNLKSMPAGSAATITHSNNQSLIGLTVLRSFAEASWYVIEQTTSWLIAPADIKVKLLPKGSIIKISI